MNGAAVLYRLFPPRPGRRCVDRACGFSLIEILVALTVLAVALGAAVQATGQQARHAIHLRDRSVGHWVAMNHATEQRIRRHWPAPGLFQGEEQMAGRRWYWQVQVSDTQAATIRRLNIAVFPHVSRDGVPVARLEAYLAKP